MKIRNGFVSNSSTSSFCLFGICVDREEALKVAKLLDPTMESSDDDRYEAGEIVGDKLNLECSTGPYDDGNLYIGRAPETLKDDETGAQFKQSVKDKLIKYFPKAKYSWFLEAWRDG
jgi:hypothetical protein